MLKPNYRFASLESVKFWSYSHIQHLMVGSGHQLEKTEFDEISRSHCGRSVEQSAASGFVPSTSVKGKGDSN